MFLSVLARTGAKFGGSYFQSNAQMYSLSIIFAVSQKTSTLFILHITRLRITQITQIEAVQ